MTPTFRLIPLEQLQPSPTNPRKRFDEAKLAELAESIKNQGIVQPLVVREIFDGPGTTYEVIAGERRYRASKLAGVAEVPCMVQELTDGAVLEIQIIENNQREDVHPLEECDGFQRILASGIYGSGVAAASLLAVKIGKSTKYVYDRIKFKDLSPEAWDEFAAGEITAGHAILLARLTAETQHEILTSMLWETRWEKGEYMRGTERRNAEWSTRRLAEHIRQHAGVHLNSCSFDQACKDLLPQAGSCDDCPKRSGNDPFYEEGSPHDLCLDRQCLHQKLGAHVKAVKAALGPNAILLSQHWSTTGKGVLSRDKWAEVGEAAKAGKDAVVVEGGEHQLGRVLRVKLAAEGAKAGPPAKSESEKETERRVKVQKEYKKSLFTAIMREHPQEPDLSFLRFVASQAFDRVYAAYEKKIVLEGSLIPTEQDLPAWLTSEDTTAGDLAQFVTACFIASELTVASWNPDAHTPNKMLQLATAWNVDPEPLKRRAEEKFPAKVQTPAGAAA